MFSTLPKAAIEGPITFVRDIGKPWLGASLSEHPNLPAADDTAALLHELGEAIERLNRTSEPCPRLYDVRITGRGSNSRIVADVDVGLFILPIILHPTRYTPLPQMVERLARLVQFALDYRYVIAARELWQRRKFKRCIAGVGHHTAPLWCRMTPVKHDLPPDTLLQIPYDASIVMLSPTLDWQPAALSSIGSFGSIERHCRGFARKQQRRWKILDTLKRAAAIGFIDAVAMAAIKQHQRDPAAALRLAIEAARDLFDNGVTLFRGAHKETLYYADGVLRAEFTFGPSYGGQGSGHFDGLRLTIEGDYPETLAAGSVGYPLSSFVDHPLLIESYVRVSSAKIRKSTFELFHDGEHICMSASGEIINRARNSIAAAHN